MNLMTLLSRRKKRSDLQRRRKGIAIGHMKGEAVRQHSPSVDQRNGTVQEGIPVQLATGHAIRFEEQVGQCKPEGVLKVSALDLEMMLGEVHALVPDDSRQVLHGALALKLPEPGTMTTPAVPRRLRLAVCGDYTSHWKEQVEPTPAQQPMTSDEFGSQYRLLKQMAVKEGRSYTAEHVPSGRAVLVHIMEEDRIGGPSRLRTLLDGLDPGDRSRVLDTITVENSLVVVTQFLQDFDGLEPWLRARSAEPVTPPPTPAASPQEAHGEFTRLFRSSENTGGPPVILPAPGSRTAIRRSLLKLRLQLH